MARRKSRRASELEERIDDLYVQPLAEFTSARNALAGELKAAGDREAAERIRELAKPVSTAWAVNRLYRDDRETFEELLETGATLRRLQTKGRGDAGTLRQVTESKRAALRTLLRRVETLASESGASAGRSALRRIEANLEAIAVYGDAGPEQELGRMTADLELPGFEALLATGVRRPKRSAKKRVSRADSRKLERARTARDKARKEVERVRAEIRKAERGVQKAEKRHEETREMVRAAERDLDDSRSRHEEVEKALTRARESLAKAEATLQTASKRIVKP